MEVPHRKKNRNAGHWLEAHKFMAKVKTYQKKPGRVVFVVKYSCYCK
jgi:hypothetical protein